MKGLWWGEGREGYGFGNGDGLLAGAEEVEDLFNKRAETGRRKLRHGGAYGRRGTVGEVVINVDVDEGRKRGSGEE